MSIAWMAYAWKDGPMDSNERYVYLAIADYANEDGEAFPSLPTIVRKTRLSESTVRRTIASLEAGGWLKVVRGQGSGHPSRYTLKKVSLRNLSEEKVSSGKVSGGQKKGVTVTEKGCQADGERCQADKTPTPPYKSNHQEPSLNHQGTGANGELMLAGWLLEEAGVPATSALVRVVAESIRLLAKQGGTTKDAAEFILAAAKAGEAEGDTINSFWFQDRRYNPQVPKKTARQKRIDEWEPSE